MGPRQQTRAVDDYLRALEQHANATSRRRSAEQIEADAAEVAGELEEATGTRRLDLLQQRENLQREALEIEDAAASDLTALEDRFIRAALPYSERKGISYSTWREFGVEKSVLERAGIPRTRRPNNRN